MKRRETKPQTRRRGFMALEAAIGLVVLVMLAAALAAGASGYRKGMTQLANRRAATRLAEETLLQLQLGRAVPREEEAEIEVTPLKADDAGGPAWVRVGVKYRGASVTLVGAAQPKSAEATR